MIHQATNEIVFSLLRKKSLEEVSWDQLNDLSKDYPFFSIVHFLKAKKAIDTQHPQKNELVQKCLVYAPVQSWMLHTLSLCESAQSTASNELEQLPSSVGAPQELIHPGLEEKPSSALGEISIVQAESASALQDFSTQQDSSIQQESTGHQDTASKLQQEDTKIETVPSPGVKADKFSTTSEDLVPIDPFHTVDYFASQGIKLTAEDLNKDQMGKQLKRFTDWLKTMKRIPANESAADIDESTNQNIQNLAAHSNVETSILTESMAQVLVKQKKYSKAIEVYQKLSLQIPSKSTYFATLIEDLRILNASQ